MGRQRAGNRKARPMHRPNPYAALVAGFLLTLMTFAPSAPDAMATPSLLSAT